MRILKRALPRAKRKPEQDRPTKRHMILVDKHLTDLVAGYDAIQLADDTLKGKWRRSLLAGYARRLEAYEIDRLAYREHMAAYMARARYGFWFASILLILGVLSAPAQLYLTGIGDLRGILFCLAPALVLSGTAGWLVMGFLWLLERDRSRPVPPAHPMKNGLIKPLTPLWLEGLRGSLPSEYPYQGAPGEYDFLENLQELDESGFLLYRLQQAPGDDIDVTLVSESGIWVFEVKYLKGIVRWRDGRWTHQKTYYGPRGVPITEARSPDEPYHEQWRRMAKEVEETLRRKASGLITRLPNLTRIRGGIVFTHPEGRYDIPPGSPFNWGIIPFWLEKISTVLPVGGVDERSSLQALEALLIRHQQVNNMARTRSMQAYAEQLVQQAEAGLEKWVRES